MLAWYDRHARVLPWRWRRCGAANGRTRTASGCPKSCCNRRRSRQSRRTTRAFLRTGRRSMRSRPPVSTMCCALGPGLGYYARARNLHACAKAVVERHGGIFPSDVDALRALPGIGDYTAAAIAAIAFDARGGAGRRKCRARGVAPVRGRRGIAGGQSQGSSSLAASLLPARSRRRFRASVDGSRRHHLFTQAPGLRAVPVERCCASRIRARRSGDVSTQGAQARRPIAPWRGLCRASCRRPRAAAQTSGQGPARVDDGSARQRVGA